MVDRPERLCVPIEVEPVSLHREPPGAARLRRELKRERRRERRERRLSLKRAGRLLARLAGRPVS